MRMAAGNTVVCNIDTVNGNAGAVTTIIVTPNQVITSGTVITNNVVVSATEIPVLVSDQITATVIRQVDFEILKLSSKSFGNVTFGTPLTYTIGVTNTGPSLATGVAITDTLPPSLTFTITSVSPAMMTGCAVGNIFAGGSTIHCNPLLPMAVGSSASIQISTSVNITPTNNIIVNTAGVKSSENNVPNTSEVDNLYN